MSNQDDEYKDKVKELGAEIRSRREELGLSIEQVQRETKIRSKYIMAVENGDEKEAPGTAYYKAFLKTYATYLGLDGAKYSHAYQEILDLRESQPEKGLKGSCTRNVGRASESDGAPAQEPGAPALAKWRPPETREDRQPEISPKGRGGPAREHRRRSQISARTSHEERVPSGDLISSSPRHHIHRPRRSGSLVLWVILIVLVVGATAAAMHFLMNAKEAPPSATLPSSTSPNPGENPGPTGTTPPPKPVEETPKIDKQEPNPETTIFTIDRSPLSLSIKAGNTSCWLSVKVDGKQYLEETLAAGDEVKVSAKSEILVRAGRPWAISFTLNGKDLGVAGELGPAKDITFKTSVNNP